MNSMYRRITSINWRKEAIKIKLQNDEMIELIKNTKATRERATTKTKRAEFDELHYGLDQHGDYCELYLYKDGNYYIYSNNMLDPNKNIDDGIKRADRIFEAKFREFNNITLRKAFGFVDKTLKRCIPKQFYYINNRFLNKRLKVSSIDASSQYPSGCLGLLPDMHTAIRVKGRVVPTEEYRFAFYASGHCAEYGVFDTHDWLSSKYAFSLFRLDQKDDYRLRTIPDEDEETILMKASDYTMDATWNYFYDIKNSCEKDTEEYKKAKLIMNETIGCWHRKDKSKKRIMTYDDHGSYKLAHIVAIAIARGNQKILNMIDKIGEFFVIHVCVDGIIYLGDRKFGIDDSKLGVFCQEFINADFEMAGINVYCAKSNDKCIKFKHGGFDLLDGKEINEDQDFDFSDLYKLSAKEHVGDILWEEN